MTNPTEAMREAFEKWCKDNLDPNADPMAALWLSEAFEGGCVYALSTLPHVTEAEMANQWRPIESAPQTEIVALATLLIEKASLFANRNTGTFDVALNNAKVVIFFGEDAWDGGE